MQRRDKVILEKFISEIDIAFEMLGKAELKGYAHENT